LGAEIMAIFAQGLRDAGDSDFTLIVGDIVPFGSKPLYENVCQLIEQSANGDVLTLKGNHDTLHYEEFFGMSEYCLMDPNTLLVILDNSGRTFSDSGLEMLSQALREHSRKNIVLAMHIPPPNDVCPNSVSAEEWAKVTACFIKANREPDWIICGHVHSYLETHVGSSHLVLTGGAGARVEEVPGVVMPNQHRVRFEIDDNGELTFQKLDICPQGEWALGTGEGAQKMQDMISQAFRSECVAHVRYSILAQEATQQGLPELAKLYRATADSELVHATNFLHALPWGTVEESLETSLTLELEETGKIYPQALAFATEHGFGISGYAFSDALEAEKVHVSLLHRAKEKSKELPEQYYTCTSCGYTFSGDTHPKNCPICGAPFDKIREVPQG
jgi:rubrerythrin/calcineurin-like phosphoesterase family protein